MQSELLSAAAIGLLGAGHCLGMCGGLVGAMTLAIPAEQSRWPYLLGYNAGRIISYMAAGAVSAGIAGLLPTLFPAWGGMLLRILAGIMMLLLGLYLLGRSAPLRALERVGNRLWRRIQPYARRFVPLKQRRHALLAGMLWGWLPCGLVYSTLSLSATSANPLHGALIMLVFGLATLPANLSLGIAGNQLKMLVSNKKFRNMSALMLAALGFHTIIVAI